jgi:hypothetical protein
MNRLFVYVMTGTLLVAGAGAAKMIAGAQAPGPVFIAGDQPVTEDQVRNKLQSEGWIDVRTTHEGRFIQATASKNGQTQKIIVDSRTGRLRAQAGDDDDDD